MDSKGAISSTFPEKKKIKLVFFQSIKDQNGQNKGLFFPLFFQRLQDALQKSCENPSFPSQKRAFSNENITRSWIFSASNSIQTHNTPISLKVIQCMTKVVVQDHRVWTFQNFPATRILCEIDFGECRSVKNAVFDIFKNSEF